MARASQDRGPIDRSLFGFIWHYSKRDQLILLAVTAVLFPLLFLTLELPKRIINDAIGSNAASIDVLGFEVGRIAFLGILCAALLVSVLAHGLLKMRINTMKGVLAERMLRRLRYGLIAQLLRFPPDYFQRTSQGELVSMITAETEPMGGMMGDAITQPVMQAGQMATILFFLFLQSPWFGLAATALIPVQAWLIPRLQRRINKLNKARIAEVRALASQIGETAAGAASLRIHGGWRYRMAVITQRLGQLFEIRFVIYQKKFFMKFLNNFITQLTPFLFFAVGGYLVIQGSVSLGALVAALAAHKELSSPWKELLDYYTQAQEMSQRWDIVVDRFTPNDMLEDRFFEAPPDPIPALLGPIELDSVSLRDPDGNQLLDDITITLPQGAIIGVTGPSEEDRRAFAQLITRDARPSSGKISVAGQDMATLHPAVIAARVGHADSRPVMFQGSVGDNMLMPLWLYPGKAPTAETDEATRHQLFEAERSGNSVDPLAGGWQSPARAAMPGRRDLQGWLAQITQAVGSGPAVMRRGLDQSFEPARHPELAVKLIALRPILAAALDAAGLQGEVHRFVQARYNPAVPAAETLFFVTPRAPITQAALLAEPGLLDHLAAQQLDVPLLDLSQEIIGILRQIFGGDGAGHPLFAKLGLDPALFEQLLTVTQQIQSKPKSALSVADKRLMLTVPFVVSEQSVGVAFDPEIKARIETLAARHTSDLPPQMAPLYARLDPAEIAPGLSVLENLLFGKIADATGTRADDLQKLALGLLTEHGLAPLILQLIFEAQVTLGGGNLPSALSEPLALGRAVVKRPDILVLEQVLASLDPAQRLVIFTNLRRLLPDATIICLGAEFHADAPFDMRIELRQGRIDRRAVPAALPEEAPASADLQAKLRALEATTLFAGLDRKQLRLLAFGARWFRAAAGEEIFDKGDGTSDGAYMILKGEAGLYDPDAEGGELLIATVGPGQIVGELGLIRHEPRALAFRAQTELETLRLGAEEFLAVVENDAATSFKLLQVLAGYAAK